MEARFRSEVLIDGINPYVVVPERVVRRLGAERRPRVLVKVAPCVPPAQQLRAARTVTPDSASLARIARLAPDGWFRSTFVRRGPQERWLFLDRWMREAAGVSVGDCVSLRLRPDAGARQIEMPLLLQQALDSDPEARARWLALPPSRRKEILAYLGFLKTPAAIERNVRKVIVQLRPPGA